MSAECQPCAEIISRYKPRRYYSDRSLQGKVRSQWTGSRGGRHYYAFRRKCSQNYSITDRLLHLSICTFVFRHLLTGSHWAARAAWAYQLSRHISIRPVRRLCVRHTLPRCTGRHRTSFPRCADTYSGCTCSEWSGPGRCIHHNPPQRDAFLPDPPVSPGWGNQMEQCRDTGCVLCCNLHWISLPVPKSTRLL